MGQIISGIPSIFRTRHLLIIDDFGIQPFDNPARLSLLELIEDPYGKRSTILTSQLPLRQWHDVIGEKTVAHGVLDQIVHNAHRIEQKVIIT